MSSQSSVRIIKILNDLVNKDHCLFAFSDLRGILPELSLGAFKALISRLEKKGALKRVCRGIYLYPLPDYDYGLLLFHTVARLRANEFNYISLETALSDTGVISQTPINWITVMSSGRRNIIRCGEWGTIEFVHTSRNPADCCDWLTYDSRSHMWRASTPLAMRDMWLTRRSMDLVNREAIDEFV